MRFLGTNYFKAISDVGFMRRIKCLLLFAFILLLGLSSIGCGEVRGSSIWASTYSMPNFAIQQISMYIDFVLIRPSETGQPYVVIQDSLDIASDINNQISSLVFQRKYRVTDSQLFSVGAFANTAFPVGLAKGVPFKQVNSPFHIDPELVKRTSTKEALIRSETKFAEMIAGGESARKSGGINAEDARLLAFKGKSHAVLLVLGVLRKIPGETETEPSGSDIKSLSTSFIAVGYFRADNGETLYSHVEPLSYKASMAVIRSAIRHAHAQIKIRPEIELFPIATPSVLPETPKNRPQNETTDQDWLQTQTKIEGTESDTASQGALTGQPVHYLMNKASANGEVIHKLPDGATIKILRKESEWVLVQTPDGKAKGWILAKWVRIFP